MLKMPSTKIRGLFFGDALSDYEAAINLNFKFICVSEDSEWAELDSFLSCKGETIIENFDESLVDQVSSRFLDLAKTKFNK